MKHALVALSAKGYGETILGVHLANQLVESGDEVVFFVHETGANAVAGTPFTAEVVCDAAIPLLGFLLDRFIRDHKPDTIVLSDYFTCVLGFQRANLDFSFLKVYGIPILAIDTWEGQDNNRPVDVFVKSRRTMPDWWDQVDIPVTPVPIGKQGEEGVFFSALPEPFLPTRKVRRHVRRDLGIGPDDRAILFCTSQWQHAKFASKHANRIARNLPQLIAHYVRVLGPRVRLVHVGPSRFNIDLPRQYVWLPPLRPEEFEVLLASMDLVLTANVSATTVARAIASGVPVLSLVNSIRITNGTDVEKLLPELSKWVRNWVANTAPIYPFYLWPLGYYSFLHPVLDKNDYMTALPTMECLEEQSVLEALEGRLFDAETRVACIEKQERYLATVQAMRPVANQINERIGILAGVCAKL